MHANPKLSIIVPFYNVEKYIGDCLASIANNSFGDFEVILVDDGSRDGSVRIANHFAETDPRFRVLHQPNRGNGAARNVAMRVARGAYIAFADADDVVPRDAYSVLLQSLVDSCSDFATGRVKRINDFGKVSKSKLHDRALKSPAAGTNVHEREELLGDTCLWNKIFRRDFALRHVYPIPEACVFEDVFAVTRAYIAATAVNVVDETVYCWRKRGDQSSITQGMHLVATMNDRYRMLGQARSLIAETRPALLTAFDAKCLAVDVPLTLRALSCGNRLYRLTAFRNIARLLADSELIKKSSNNAAAFPGIAKLLCEGDFHAADQALERQWGKMSTLKMVPALAGKWQQALRYYARIAETSPMPR